MKRITFLCMVSGLLLCGAACSRQESPADSRLEMTYAWQKISHPDVERVAAQFATPPAENAPWVIWGWDGPMTEEVIRRDLDSLASRNVKAVSIEAGYNMDNAPYLSEGWFKNVRFAAEQAAAHGMKVWIIDEGKYPSGFAGGKFSQEKPELRMRGLSVAERVEVEGGAAFDRTLDDATIVSAVAVSRQDRQKVEVVPVTDGAIHWTAPEGSSWQVSLVRADFRTSVTRAANNPTRGKDATNSLCDYLSEAAVAQFIEFTHEQYKKYCGDLFGSVILGFRGDEPDYGFTPWTPDIPAIFKAAKGYDIVPYLGAVNSGNLPDALQQVKADYWDVWSGLFRDNFFTLQADWHRANGLEYLVHLNHEDRMTSLITSSGDFFRNMRHVQIPGVDAIWNQIWPGTVANFPKLASSSAHLFGKPRAFSESFAAYNPGPDPAQAKWVIDYQLARGINVFEFMFWGSSAQGWRGPSGWMGSPEFPGIVQYANRMCYVLSQGVPTASVGIYYPTSSLWMGDQASDQNTWTLVQSLLDRQYDFDFVDDQSLGEVMTLSGGRLMNLSGQSYATILVPACQVMPQKVYQRLKKFATQGGKVCFIGALPTRLSGKTFREMTEVTAQDFAWATVDPEKTLSDVTDGLLPEAEIKLDQPCRNFTFAHRKLNDAEVYFLFNENDSPVSRTVTFAASGKAELWDAATGEISPLEASEKDGGIAIPLSFEGWESKCVVIR